MNAYTNSVKNRAVYKLVFSVLFGVYLIAFGSVNGLVICMTANGMAIESAHKTANTTTNCTHLHNDQPCDHSHHHQGCQDIEIELDDLTVQVLSIPDCFTLDFCDLITIDSRLGTVTNQIDGNIFQFDTGPPAQQVQSIRSYILII